MEPSYVRRILEGTTIIAGLSAASYGAYLSYESAETGALISLAGCASTLAGAVSRSWRIRELEEIAEQADHAR